MLSDELPVPTVGEEWVIEFVKKHNDNLRKMNEFLQHALDEAAHLCKESTKNMSTLETNMASKSYIDYLHERKKTNDNCLNKFIYVSHFSVKQHAVHRNLKRFCNGMFICHLCKKIFVSDQKINLHIVRHIKKEQPLPTFRCGICSFPAKTRLEIINHLVSSHKGQLHL